MLLVLDRYLKTSGRAQQVSKTVPPLPRAPYAFYKSGRTRLKSKLKELPSDMRPNESGASKQSGPGWLELVGDKQFSKYVQTLSHPKITRIYMFLGLIFDLYGHRGRKPAIFPR